MSAPTIPATARAAVLKELGKPLVLENSWPVTQPADLLPGQCLVKIEYTGLCHSDIHIMDGDWDYKATTPHILGHEGVGRVVSIGEHSDDSDVKIGDRVGLKFNATVCSRCEMCMKGEDPCCALSQRTSHGFTIAGTFADYAVAYVNYVTPIPAQVDSVTATSLLCAGLTVYAALQKARTKVGDWVAIGGAGGGLGHLGVQFAVAMGLRVIAIDTGAEKKALCARLGAEKWVDFKESGDNLVQDVIAAGDGLGPHAAILAVGTPAPFNAALMYLRATGTLVAVGMPAGGGALNVPIVMLIAKALTILGHALGTRQQAKEVMDLAARGKVRVNAEVFDMDKVNDAIQKLRSGAVSGRIALKISGDK